MIFGRREFRIFMFAVDSMGSRAIDASFFATNRSLMVCVNVGPFRARKPNTQVKHASHTCMFDLHI